MYETLLSNPYILFIWLSCAMLLTMGVVVSSALLKFRLKNLPAATAWVDLDEKVQRLRVEKVELEEKAKELQRLIGERDHVAGETAALEERRDAVKLELSALDDAKKQIDDVKRLAADVATELALKQSELETLNVAISSASEELETLNKQIVAREAHLLKSQDSLKEELEGLKKELDQLRPEIDQLRSERGQLLNARSEATELIASNAILQSELATRKSELKELDDKSFNLKVDIADLDKQYIVKKSELDFAIQDVNDLKAQIIDNSEKLKALEAEQKELRHQKTLLQAEIQGLEIERDGTSARGGTPKTFDQRVLDDLKVVPKVLESSNAFWKPEDEEAALYQVADYLRNLNLEYPDRVIRSFHTALKINDIAQLTVLAGVSGTGKSLLPRRYAEAMGIRFLPFAVEPRWDSPQDLLGFYNYIEKRFKATDLARALVHIDPYDTSGLASDRGHADDVMIVLLDEMNLARVEYYFSEFLSRLEARPSWIENLTEDSRRDSMIPVEILGEDKKQIRLYPSHNMLFVGTMNDDESTQALSDKVLDRGNIMQFAAPDTFAQVRNVKTPSPPNRRLSFKTWRKWIRPSDKLTDSQEAKTNETIQKLASIMNECGRPFGHRLNAAIRTYVANYPLKKGDLGDVSIPLSDQIELRILPKLRGLQLDEHGLIFEKLKDLIGNDLKDDDLKHRLDELVERQRSSGGLFNWRGITRSSR